MDTTTKQRASKHEQVKLLNGLAGAIADRRAAYVEHSKTVDLLVNTCLEAGCAKTTIASVLGTSVRTVYDHYPRDHNEPYIRGEADPQMDPARAKQIKDWAEKSQKLLKAARQS